MTTDEDKPNRPVNLSKYRKKKFIADILDEMNSTTNYIESVKKTADPAMLYLLETLPRVEKQLTILKRKNRQLEAGMHIIQTLITHSNSWDEFKQRMLESKNLKE